MIESTSPTVTIAGGGMAGITAALALAKRGYDVTLLEGTDRLGGNLGASCKLDTTAERGERPVEYEVFPHMFGDWYVNFFDLVQEVGLARGTGFRRDPRWGYVSRSQPGQYRFLVNDGSVLSFWRNLFSGVAPVADIFLADYAVLDVLTQNIEDRLYLYDPLTLGGFLSTRPYATPGMLQVFNAEMMDIWAIDAYVTSLYAYQCFVRYQARRPRPSNWATTENSYDLIIRPLEKLLVQQGVRIRLRSALTGITVEKGRVTQISIQSGVNLDAETPGADGGSVSVEDVDALVLAVPRANLGTLMVQSATPGGMTVAEREPSLALTQTAETARLPVLYVAFKHAVDDVPECWVALDGSNYALTFRRVRYLEQALEVPTVLALAISNPLAVPVQWTPETMRHSPATWSAEQKEGVRLILEEFRTFIGFNFDDIDQNKLYFQGNFQQSTLLFKNVVGSTLTAPKRHDRSIENLYFAVGTKGNPVTIATVECAVVGGLQAAQAVWTHNPASHGNTVAPIRPRIPPTYPKAVFWAWKLALAPYAAAAKIWSEANPATAWLESSRSSAANRPAPLASESRQDRPAADRTRVAVIDVAARALTASATICAGLAAAMQQGILASRPAIRQR